MKPLLRSVVAISLLLSIHALPQNIEDVKELPQSKELVLEAEESKAQERVERCTTCTSVGKVKSLTALPGAEIHSQQSFQGCSTDKGCAGIKVKDGNIIERYGNADAFNAAAAADINKDFTFHAAGALGDIFGATLGNSANPPFWWMNKDSPFKAGSGATFEKYSQSESSSFSGGANAGNFGAGALNLAANPFLNGDLSKGLSIAGAGAGVGIKPSSFQSSSAYESSYSSSSNGAVDLSKNPFLNGGFKAGQAAGLAVGQAAGLAAGQAAGLAVGQAAGFQGAFAAPAANSQGFGAANSNFGAANSNFDAATSNFGATVAANSQGFNAGGYKAGFGAGTIGTGYTGSSPSPFAASSGSNINLIQSEKANEFDYEQQQQTQQNIDEIFQSAGNVGLEVSGGDLQQACNSLGYVCALKTQCTNGVVNANVAALLQTQPKKPYCSTLTEVCCRIDVTRLASGLGVGSSIASQGASTFNAQRGSSFGSQSSFGKGTTQSAFGSGIGSSLGVSSAKGTNRFGSGTTLGSTSSGAFGSSFGAKGFGSTATFGANKGVSTIAPTTGFGPGYKPTSQSNFIDTDSFSAGSETAGVYRPGAVGTVLKPGIPYLPPVDNTNSGTNIVSSTVFPSPPTFVTAPRPVITPRPFTTLRPITTRKPTYIPPPIPRPITSTAAPAYLPPIGEQTIQRETIVPPYSDGSLILDQVRPGTVKPTLIPIPSEIPAGCAAALKCTPIEFCTAEGVISNTTVILTRDQDAYRVPLTDCRDLATGLVGKCCRDPWYTDPWPTNQLGKWVPGVFGGNDGKYVPDSRPSPNNVRPPATARPPATGSVYLNNFITPKPTVSAYRPPVTPVTPFPAKGQFGLGGQGQFGIGGQGQYGQGGRGQVGIVGQGQIGSGSQTNTAFAQGQRGQGNRGQGAFVSQGQGEIVSQGQGQYGQVGVGQIGIGGTGQYGISGQGQQTQFGIGQKGVGLGVTTGQGQYGIQGQGLLVSQGEGQLVSQGQGTAVTQGTGFGIREGQGQFVTQGQGTLVSQGVGQGVRQGQGAIVSQGQGGFGSQGAGGLGIQGEGGLVSQGQGAYVSQGIGQGVRQGQGAYVSQGVGQGISQGQGAYVSQGVGQGVTQGFGQGVIQGQGELVSQGNGALVSQGFGTGIREGQGQYVSQGQGALVSQGFGQGIRRGQGQLVSQGKGQYVSQGGGVITSQGFGQAIRQGVGQIVTQGQGQIVSQGQGFGVENEYGESVNRVFLQRYTGGGGQCGVLNPQRPAGNRKELEVDFGEIPWQAMVLLQTNKSLLCGGVITRPDVVVTSAACVDGLEAKNVLIKGGEWKLGIDDEPLPFQIVQVKTILRHPLYKSGSLLYDAAILVLTENLRFAKNIYPICLPEAEDTYDALYAGEGTCIVTGWGKQVLQAHLSGAIMHSLNVSLIRPDDCQAKLTSDYPHLLEQYDEDSCVCAQPSDARDNICRVDIGSALACTTGNGQYVMRGVYSWDSGCAVGNQLGAFYKFDIEWYQWAIGLIESVRFAKYSTVTKITTTKVTGIKGGVKGTGIKNLGTGSTFVTGKITSGSVGDAGKGFQVGNNQFGFGNQGSQAFSSVKGFGKVSASSSAQSGGGAFNFGDLKPISNGFSATYSEKKVFQTEPKYITYTTKPEIISYTTKPEIVTFTTKPEIVTFTTKPEYFTYTTKPKYVTYTTKPEIVTYTTKPKIVTYTTKPQIITYTTKPQIIRYETSGSGTNPQYVAPGTSLSESFSDIVSKHTHDAKCKCIEGKK